MSNAPQNTPVDRDTAATAKPKALAHMAARGKLAAEREQRAFETALRVAFGRMAAQCPGLEGQADAAQVQRASLAEVLELAEPNMFFSLLEGQSDRMGLLMACPQVLGAMVEAQATGTVLPDDAVARKPTRTDAALMAPLIESFLRCTETICADMSQYAWVAGYVYGSFLDDPRPLGLVLDDGGYHVIRMRVSLGLGAKQGDWLLVLPDADVARPSAAASTPQADPEYVWEKQMQATISASTVQIDAVLCRLQLSLNEALRLRVGDVLRIPETTLEALALESLSREKLVVGRLGQARGHRAVRLTADPGELTDPTGATPVFTPIPASVRSLHKEDRTGTKAAVALDVPATPPADTEQLTQPSQD